MKKVTKKRLTKEERRVIILKDAVKQLIAKKLKAEQDSIISNIDRDLIPNNYDDKRELKSILEKAFKIASKPLCNVCARGALLISTIHKENSWNSDICDTGSGSFKEESNIDKRLMVLFSAYQIKLIENAFEACSGKYSLEQKLQSTDACWGINSYKLSKRDAKKSWMFGNKIEDADKKLIAIFKNAIKNNGIFKP